MQKCNIYIAKMYVTKRNRGFETQNRHHKQRLFTFLYALDALHRCLFLDLFVLYAFVLQVNKSPCVCSATTLVGGVCPSVYSMLFLVRELYIKKNRTINTVTYIELKQTICPPYSCLNIDCMLQVFVCYMVRHRCG